METVGQLSSYWRGLQPPTLLAWDPLGPIGTLPCGPARGAWLAQTDRVDAAAVARRRRSGDFIFRQCSSKFGRGAFQRRSSTVSNTGTSTRSVASVRNNRASFHALNNDSDSTWALRMEGCHARQSCGMSSRWGYCDNTRAAAFWPQPATPGNPSALSPTTAR